MQQIKEKYKDSLKYFVNNKIFNLAIIIITILGFGFTITHGSIGVDDTAFDRYFYGDKVMLGIGRWGAYIIYKILNINYFVPFWIDLIATIIIVATAYLWCIFLKKNFKEKLPISAYIIFACLYISYPIINEIFIYENCNIAVMLGNFLASFGIMLLYENFNYLKKKTNYIYIVLILTFALSTYEACAQLILLSICITILLMYVLNNKIKTKNIFKYLFISLIILAISAFLDVGISKIINIFVPASEVAEKYVNWGKYGFIDSLKILVYYIKEAVTNIQYYPVIIFDIATIIGFLIFIIQSYKNNNLMLLLIFIGMCISNFAISILQLNTVFYRASSSWGLFVAIIFMITYFYMLEFNITKILAEIAITIIILQQSLCLNQAFYNDYTRYQKDLTIAREIIYDLQKNCNISKPLVITGNVYKSVRYTGSQVNSLSVLWWGKKAWGDEKEFIKFLNIQGYSFKYPTEEQIEKGNNESVNMERFPKDGYIKELDDCIIINF